MKKYRKTIIICITFIVLFLSFFFGLSYLDNEKNKTINGINKTYNGYLETVDGIYFGEIFKDCFDGYGQFEYFSKEIYVGDFKNSQLSGNGVMKFPGIGYYNGNYNKSLRTGNGTFTWENGDSYTGNWDDDMINGQGKYVFKDGSYYEGEFKKNIISSGIFTIKKDDYTINIKISNGAVTKNVSILYDNGDYLKGTYEQSFTGKVKITYSDGSIYEGDIKNSMRNGEGTYKWKSSECYEGTWVDDKMSGDGQYYYKGVGNYPFLVGKFSYGKPTGICDYFESETVMYITEWENGKCQKVKEK